MNNRLDELGRSATLAVRFLREVHRDVAQLLEELDGLMTAKGSWRATEKGRVSYDLSNAMSPYGWLAECLFRFYSPAEAGAGFRTLLGFVIRFDPPAGFDQPVLLGVAARYDAPTDWLTVYNRWKSSDPAIEGLAKTPGPRPLSDSEIASLLPTSKSVVALTVPLCSLTGPDDLRSAVVEPLLAAIAQSPKQGVG